MGLWFAKVAKNIMLRLIHGAQLPVRRTPKHNSCLILWIKMENLTKNSNSISDMTYRRRNAGVISHAGLLFVCGGDDGSSNLSNVEVILRYKFHFYA